jgi:hypothetical protein
MNANEGLDARMAAHATDDAEALQRLWTRVEDRTSLRRRRRFISTVVVTALAVVGASGGAVAYAAHLKGDQTPPALRSVGVFGDPGYASSAAEESSLARVARVANRAGDLGYFRSGAAEIRVQVPSSSPLVGTTQMVDEFQLTYAASQFTRQSLAATLKSASQIARSDTSAEVNFTLAYDADIDAVVLRGKIPKDLLARLNSLPGVVAIGGAGVQLQSGLQVEEPTR